MSKIFAFTPPYDFSLSIKTFLVIVYFQTFFIYYTINKIMVWPTEFDVKLDEVSLNNTYNNYTCPYELKTTKH